MPCTPGPSVTHLALSWLRDGADKEMEFTVLNFRPKQSDLDLEAVNAITGRLEHAATEVKDTSVIITVIQCRHLGYPELVQGARRASITGGTLVLDCL